MHMDSFVLNGLKILLQWALEASRCSAGLWPVVLSFRWETLESSFFTPMRHPSGGSGVCEEGRVWER